MEDVTFDVKALCDRLEPGISWRLGVVHGFPWKAARAWWIRATTTPASPAQHTAQRLWVLDSERLRAVSSP